MKQIIDLRPDCHRLEERIRAHGILCWLALLLICIIETQADTTWLQTRCELQRLHTGTFTGSTGTFQQVAGLTKPQRDLLAKLGFNNCCGDSAVRAAESLNRLLGGPDAAPLRRGHRQSPKPWPSSRACPDLSGQAGTPMRSGPGK